MTQLTNAEFKIQTANLFATNGVGAISATDLRTQMDNMPDSVPFKTTGAAVAPGSNDDGANTSGNGVIEIGDIWIDETGGEAYINLDNSAGAAIWSILTGAGGGGTVNISGTPVNNQLAIWINSNTIEGDSNLTWDGSSLAVTGNISINSGEVTQTTNSATLATIAQTAIASFNATTFLGAKIVIQVTDTVAAERQISEMLITHDGTTASATEYAIIFSGAGTLATFNVDINTGNVRLLATSASTNSTNYTVYEVLMS